MHFAALIGLILVSCFINRVTASIGDNLPDFRHCVSVGENLSCLTPRAELADGNSHVLRRIAKVVMASSVSSNRSLEWHD